VGSEHPLRPLTCLVLRARPGWREPYRTHGGTADLARVATPFAESRSRGPLLSGRSRSGGSNPVLLGGDQPPYLFCLCGVAYPPGGGIGHGSCRMPVARGIGDRLRLKILPESAYPGRPSTANSFHARLSGSREWTNHFSFSADFPVFFAPATMDSHGRGQPNSSFIRCGNPSPSFPFKSFRH
jgi:hypothetical protein